MTSALVGLRAGCGSPRGRLQGELQLWACLPAAPEALRDTFELAPKSQPCWKAVFHIWWQCFASLSLSASQPCPAPPSSASPDAEHSKWHQGTDPSQDRHGEKLCFLSCQACKTSVTRGCAGQMGFPFGSKGEIPFQSGDLLRGIPCRVLAINPAANSMAAPHSLLFPLVICTIWVAGFEGIKQNLPSYNLAFYFFIPCTVQ